MTSPISRRVSAIASTLSGASANALLGGLVTAIVFPPAIPVAVGLALLEGTSEYGKALKASEQKSEQSRADRKERRRAEQAIQINRLRGKSPVVRMETGHVHVSINAETRQAHGIILTGRHAGEPLSALDENTLKHLAQTAPDTETKDIILAFHKHLKSTPDADPPKQKKLASKQQGNTDDLGLVALGLDFLVLTTIS